MKKIINILLSVIAVLAVSSCELLNDNKPSTTVQDNATTVEGISQEIKNKIEAQDTLMKTLVLKVDTLAQALTQAQNENSELKAQVEKLESPKRIWGYITLVALALAIAALIVSLLRKGVSREKVNEIFSHNLDKSQRIEELKLAVNQLKSVQSYNKIPQSISASLQALDKRLQAVESTLAHLNSMLNNNNCSQFSTFDHRQEKGSQPQKTGCFRVGYANINSGRIFTKIFDSPKESCVFSISFKNETKGEFTIISLDKIKSRNMWQEVVEYTGSIEDATSFKVEEFGICEKYDEDTWQVTKKLKLKLIK